MPLRHTKAGWMWGGKGPFPTKAKALSVARAAYASGYKEHDTTNSIQANPRPDPVRKNAQVAQIAASIKEFGWTNPVLLDGENGIIAGHGRVLAAQKLGQKEVPTIELSHMTENQKRAYIIADNKLALNAGWDNDMLFTEFTDLKDAGYDLGLTGFSDDEIRALTPEVINEGLVDEDQTPEPPAEPKTKPGDIYQLGKHRLMCGDSTSVDAVDKLMAGQKADMVFTDPPYGIAHSGKGITANGVKGNDFGQIMGDQDVSVAIDAFALCRNEWPDAVTIFWGANYYPSTLPDGHGWIVWDKQREGDTFSGAELAFVNAGVRVDVFRHMWHGMVKASEHGQARVHPTQKPIALAEWCFNRYCANGKIIVDLFGGSGSTLIAAEKTGRIARLMELDPKYCDVIVQRWEEFTGKKAVLLNADLPDEQ
jgi:16S rRNA G966 N2-methylase RsmD